MSYIPDVETITEPLGTQPAKTAAEEFRKIKTAIKNRKVFYSVKDYGAVGDGVTNDTAAIQACVTAANTAGFPAYFPPGNYVVTSAITIDNTADSASFAPKASIIGAGASCTVITAGAGEYSVFDMLGGASGSGMHSYQMIEGLHIQKAGGGNCLGLSNIAFAAINDCSFRGANVGINGIDVLSMYVNGTEVLFNALGGVRMERGAVADGFQSGPNAIVFNACVIGNNGNYGAWFVSGANISFIGGSVEGNGLTGAAATSGKWGILVSNAGLEGGVGLNVSGTYFEYNKGQADIWLSQSSYSVAASITGATFNRIANTGYTENNIRIETSGSQKQEVFIAGCGFKHYNTYSPSSGRRTILTVDSGGGVSKAYWLGCHFSSSTDSPSITNYAGGTSNNNINAFGMVLSSGALASFTPSGGISYTTKIATGEYEIGLSNPAASVNVPIICTALNDPRVVYGWSNSASVVRVRVTSLAGALVDCTFSFAVLA